MKFDASVINYRFAVVKVSLDIIDSQAESAEAFRFFEKPFKGMTVLLVATDAQGNPRYRGPEDVVRLAESLVLSKLPWREYTVE